MTPKQEQGGGPPSDVCEIKLRVDPDPERAEEFFRRARTIELVRRRIRSHMIAHGFDVDLVRAFSKQALECVDARDVVEAGREYVTIVT